MTIQDATLAMVGFRAGGLRFAMEASSIAAMLPDTGQGVAFATLMGLEPAMACTRILSVRVERSLESIIVEEPVTTMDVAHSAIYPLPPLIAARIAGPMIRGLTWDKDGAVILVAPLWDVQGKQSQ